MEQALLAVQLLFYSLIKPTINPPNNTFGV